MTLSIPGLYESREEPTGMSHVVEGSDGPIAEIVYRPSTPMAVKRRGRAKGA